MTNCDDKKLYLYPLDGNYIASFDYQPTQRKIFHKMETVVILDRSASMQKSFEVIVQEILPLFFQKLNQNLDEKIHLITFDSKICHFHKSVNEIAKMEDFYARGATFMSNGIRKIKEILKEFNANGVDFVRILAISDGEIGDGPGTMQAAEELADYVEKFEMAISSSAVRWFTSSYDPDTDALCCLLRLNNIQASKMLDLKSNISTEEAACAWAELFKDDGLTNGTIVTLENHLCLKFPWSSATTDRVLLAKCENTFWLKAVPEKFIVDGQTVGIEVKEEISYEKLSQLMMKKVNFFVDRMKILKIIQSDDAKHNTKEMIDYFKRIEMEVPAPEDSKTDDMKDLKKRIKIIKSQIRQRETLISSVMSQIVNDHRVNKMNAAQKADYLRQTAVTKNSKSLAKRSAKATNEMDFDEIARMEAMNIAKNFHEISEIDDSSHKVSFYSYATTLEGIKTLVDFTKDDDFENATVLEILKILNIVGIACFNQIGNYVDPSAFRVEEIYSGCFVSVSDLMCVKTQSKNYYLIVPGRDYEYGDYYPQINNVIPYFEDIRIAKFLKRHASSLLDFTCSFGMRNMIVQVPKTIEYTIVAGIRGLMELMLLEKLDVNLEVFRNMVKFVDEFCGKFPAEEFTNVKSKGVNGYFLDNSGINEMIVPLIRIFKENKPEIVAEVPAMLRSIYNYEVWLEIRRNYKGQENSIEILMDLMKELLNMDVNKHKVNVDNETANPYFHDEFEYNYKVVGKLVGHLKHLNVIALLPVYLKAAVCGDIDALKNDKSFKVDSSLFRKSLDVDFSMRNYLFFNVFQALAFPTKHDRCDVDLKIMKMVDIKHCVETIEEVKTYVRNFYKKQYQLDYARKNQMESIRGGHSERSMHYYLKYTSQLDRDPEHVQMMVRKIIEAESYSEMVTAWQTGVKHNGKFRKITSSGCPGFRLLKFALGSLILDIPMRSEIITILMFGIDDKKSTVWNNGKAFGMRGKGRNYYKPGYLLNGSYDEWDYLCGKHKISTKTDKKK